MLTTWAEEAGGPYGYVGLLEDAYDNLEDVKGHYIDQGLAASLNVTDAVCDSLVSCARV